ncbi:hypothetical protein [Novosphingobium sp. THN1]|uniref:Eco57I restriction-modification methylase domain-containing protein n=1 Tax=Novosphingobium sp. THN1 TaxID=1016987 RepID=UPI001F0781EA|nr:hypothetical protein [Novosphingobium sp. THN1]
MPEDTVGQVEKKRAAFEAWKADPARYATEVACDLYMAAFLMPKTEVPLNYQRAMVPTTGDVRQKLAGGNVYGPLEGAAREVAGAASVLHWPLEFPDVMVGNGGFDVVLGNPPWERIKLQEQEFFAGHPVAEEPNAAARTRAIAKLAEAGEGSPDRRLYDAFQIAKRVAEATSTFARVPGDSGGRYRYTGTGDVNTYALFAEHFLNLMGERGRAGVIVPTGIATDATTAPFFDHLVSNARLVSLFSFENEEFIFAGVHHSFRFCLMTLGIANGDSEFSFFARKVEHLSDQRRRFFLSPTDIIEINPNTRTVPVFRSQRDAELATRLYRRVPILLNDRRDQAENAWAISFGTMFHMSADSQLFKTATDLASDGYARCGVDWLLPGDDLNEPKMTAASRFVPLYEAKMTAFYDHRASSYASRGDDRGFRVLPETTLAEHQDPDFEAEPFYFVQYSGVDSWLATRGWKKDWLMGWKEITTASSERTLLPVAMPRWGVGHKILLAFPDASDSRNASLYANLNSLILDWISRQKLNGLSFSYFVLKQLPVLPPAPTTKPRSPSSSRACWSSPTPATPWPPSPATSAMKAPLRMGRRPPRAPACRARRLVCPRLRPHPRRTALRSRSQGRDGRRLPQRNLPRPPEQ